VNANLRRLLVPGVFALFGLVVLIGLGTWQVERKFWKTALIDTLTQRLEAEPAPLPPPREWASLDRAANEFRRVAFRGEFVAGTAPQGRDREARLYTGVSALRDDVKAPGYFVFAPARLPDGQMVVVNRGYVAEARPSPDTPLSALPPGPLDIVGVLRWPERRGFFDNDYSRYDDLWFVRDHLAMALRNEWGTVAPFYLEMEAPAPPGGAPKPGRLKVHLPDHHVQYALTWYGLALALVAVFAIWAIGRWREGETGSP
jgi:surfeit locus 1 family protein